MCYSIAMNEKVFSPKPQAVNPFSGNYERNKERQRVPKEVSQLSSNVFGLHEIVEAFRAAGVIQADNNSFNLEDLLRDDQALESPIIKEALQSIRMELIAKARHTFFDPAMAAFFSEFNWNNVPREYLARFNLERGVTQFELLERMPDHLLFSMLISHAITHAEKTESFLSREKKLRKNFLKNLNRLVKEGIIGIEPSTAANTLNQYTVHLQDFLSMEITEVADGVSFAPGFTNNSQDLVNISSALTPEDEEHIYTHEMFHVISGNASVLFERLDNTIPIDLRSGLVQKRGVISRNRTGFSVFSHNAREKTLEWLNEATTQDLTMLALKEDASINYAQEMELLESLLNRGAKIIPKRMLYDAYFANSTLGDLDIPPPALRSFLDAVDESFDTKNFLTRLDGYVDKHGLSKAIEALKENPGQI